MDQGPVNVRYAKSLFQLAIEKNIADGIKQDIVLIYDVFQENAELETLLEHPVIKLSRKKQILSELFEKKVSEHTMSFLYLIVKNKREKHLKSICKNYITLYEKHKGIKKAVITTSFDLSRTHAESIKKSIEKKFKAIIELETKVDKSLLGGFIIQIDDKQLDLSVARQIQELKNNFYNIDFNNPKKISKK